MDGRLASPLPLTTTAASSTRMFPLRRALRAPTAVFVLLVLLACFLWRPELHSPPPLPDRNGEAGPSPALPTSTSTSTSAASIPAPAPAPTVQESGFAYVFYATTDAYACSVLVNLHRLRHLLHARHPSHVLVSPDVSASHRARMRDLGAVVHVQSPPQLVDHDPTTYYADCLLKLMSFKLHLLHPGLTRVLALDADQLIMQNLDHLFTGLPRVDLAAPRAYWIAKDFLASTFLMIDLSDRLWDAIRATLPTAGNGRFDMDILNDLLGNEVMMLSGEFVTLNSHWEDWNLPSWYHPTRRLNMTTIARVNALARMNAQRPELQQSVASHHALGVGLLRGNRVPHIPNPSVGTTGQVAGPAHNAAPPKQTPGSLGLPIYREPAPRLPPTHPSTHESDVLPGVAAVVHHEPAPRLPPTHPSSYEREAGAVVRRDPAARSPPSEEPGALLGAAPVADREPAPPISPSDPQSHAPEPLSDAVAVAHHEPAPRFPPGRPSFRESEPAVVHREPAPRFPLSHPLSHELQALYGAAAVIHFTAVGKPWSMDAATLLAQKPDAHPILAEQFQTWRDTADVVCPPHIDAAEVAATVAEESAEDLMRRSEDSQ